MVYFTYVLSGLDEGWCGGAVWSDMSRAFAKSFMCFPLNGEFLSRILKMADACKANESSGKMNLLNLSNIEREIIELVINRKIAKQSCDVDSLYDCLPHIYKDINISDFSESFEKLTLQGIFSERVFRGKKTYNVTDKYSEMESLEIDNDTTTKKESDESFINRCYMELEAKKKEDLLNQVKSFCSTEVTRLMLTLQEDMYVKLGLKSTSNETVRTYMENEIAFLRDELRSKNEIIKILIEKPMEHNTANIPSQHQNFNLLKNNSGNKNFRSPKRFATKIIKKNDHRDFTHVNRFNNLIINDDGEENFSQDDCSSQNNTTYNNKNDETFKNKYDTESKVNVKDKRKPRKHIPRERTVSHNNYQHENIEVDKNNYGNESNEDKRNETYNPRKRSKREHVAILGDSMVKHLNGWEIKKALSYDSTISVKSFPGATIDCMNHYIQPTLKRNPDKVVIHIGTNDLKRSRSTQCG